MDELAAPCPEDSRGSASGLGSDRSRGIRCQRARPRHAHSRLRLLGIDGVRIHRVLYELASHGTARPQTCLVLSSLSAALSVCIVVRRRAIILRILRGLVVVAGVVAERVPVKNPSETKPASAHSGNMPRGNTSREHGSR